MHEIISVSCVFLQAQTVLLVINPFALAGLHVAEHLVNLPMSAAYLSCYWYFY
jgi:hypothetical protein